MGYVAGVGKTFGSHPCLPKVWSLLRETWGAWLASLEWTWFITVTFREPVPSHRQETAVHAAGNLIGRSHPLERLFLCAEPHLSRNTHLHGLLKSQIPPGRTQDLARDEIWERLFNQFGRSRVENPRGPNAVSKYVSKYCVKALGYYELWGASEGSAATRYQPGGYVVEESDTAAGSMGNPSLDIDVPPWPPPSISPADDAGIAAGKETQGRLFPGGSGLDTH